MEKVQKTVIETCTAPVSTDSTAKPWRVTVRQQLAVTSRQKPRPAT